MADIDFAAIADRAVEILGSVDPVQFQTAFDAMSVETHTVQLTENFKTEVALMSELGVNTTDDILTKIENALIAGGKDRVVRMIRSDRGINLADAQTKGLVAQMVADSVLSQAEADTLLSSNSEVQLKWPGLTTGQVSDALQKRQNGEV